MSPLSLYAFAAFQSDDLYFIAEIKYQNTTYSDRN